jgi:predicted nucleic acid-binding protein
MTVYLLDANVAIALAIRNHEHTATADSWAATVDRFALCPIVEGALVRFLIRVGESQRTAQQVLAGFAARPGYEFWPDSLSYLDADLTHVCGHRQVTDAYLMAVVRSHPLAKLATFDRALVQTCPDHTLLLNQ